MSEAVITFELCRFLLDKYKFSSMFAVTIKALVLFNFKLLTKLMKFLVLAVFSRKSQCINVKTNTIICSILKSKINEIITMCQIYTM